MGCKGICIRYKADRPKSGLRYIPGQKRCQICAIFINWQEGLLCHCCRSRLWGSPRKSKKRKVFRLWHTKNHSLNLLLPTSVLYHEVMVIMNYIINKFLIKLLNIILDIYLYYNLSRKNICKPPAIAIYHLLLH